MRNDIAKFIRKTERRLHRSEEKRVISLPEGTDNSRMTSAKICGNYTLDSNLRMSGVGDYDETTQKYKIPLRIHGANYLKGDDYAEAHIAKKITIAYNYSNDYYTNIVDEKVDGTVIIDSSMVRFKENTVYTLCSLFQYQGTVKVDRNLGISFNYSDGTFTQMRMATTEKKFYYCIPSEEGKSIVSISSNAGEYLYTRICMSKFGIFEGKHTDYDSLFEPFSGEFYDIYIEKPLYRIGLYCDELDIVSGKIKRRINSTEFNEDTAVEASESENIFKVYLPKAMRSGSAIISSYEKMSFAELEYYDSGICESEDGNFIYIKDLELFPTLDSFKEFISSAPMPFGYVLKEYETENTEVSIPYRSGKTVIEVHTAISPYRLYAEYF